MSKLPKRVHVIGICGVATSALAIAFHERGVKVTGSDKGFFPPVSTELEKHKIDFYAGWHPEKVFIGNSDTKQAEIDSEPKEDNVIIIGTASGSHNPETSLAKEKGFPTFSFAQAIGEYFVKENSIVCAGTWGKTSSSTLLSYIFETAGMDPTYMFGGISLSHESSAKLTDSKWSIFEGDEYKSSPTDPSPKFAYYKPTHLLLTAVSWDHADLYPTEESYFDAFKKLVGNISQAKNIVACIDQSGTSKILGDKTGIIYYGRASNPKVDANRFYGYKNVAQTKNGIDFVIVHGKDEFKITCPMIGLYQAENITGCFAMASELGIDSAKIVKAIGTFKGMKRRLEKRGEKGGITIFDDIAHSPEKASSVLNTLKSIYNGDIICVFEPNSGGRNRESASKYDNAFVDADMVIIPRLTKLKIASQEDVQPMEGDELAKKIGETHNSVTYIDDDSALVQKLFSTAKKGDVIAFLGSHGFRGMIEEVVNNIR